jgi:hypothetical protein
LDEFDKQYDFSKKYSDLITFEIEFGFRKLNFLVPEIQEKLIDSYYNSYIISYNGNFNNQVFEKITEPDIENIFKQNEMSCSFGSVKKIKKNYIDHNIGTSKGYSGGILKFSNFEMNGQEIKHLEEGFNIKTFNGIHIGFELYEENKYSVAIPVTSEVFVFQYLFYIFPSYSKQNLKDYKIEINDYLSLIKKFIENEEFIKKIVEIEKFIKDEI